MRAMILAAGRGERMQHLTNDLPKALLKVKGRYLIEYALQSLIAAGIKEIVINVCYKKELIKTALGDGSQYGVTIFYSEEEQALETGGGIFQALPLLGAQPFIVISCDIITDFSLKNMPALGENLAHLVLVDNPEFHSKGDYCIRNGKLFFGNVDTYTYASFGIFHPDLFQGCLPGKFRLTVLLNKAIENNLVSGEIYRGSWYNVGTPAEIESLAKFYIKDGSQSSLG